jgi:hypothetical protein
MSLVRDAHTPNQELVNESQGKLQNIFDHPLIPSLNKEGKSDLNYSLRTIFISAFESPP